MKILCVDAYGESALDWLLRCREAGHTVKWYIPKGPRSDYIGRGLIDRVDNWQSYAMWADLVFVPDNVRHIRELDAWRARGVPIMGPNCAGTEWEIDRNVGMAVLKRCGIATPDSVEFNNFKKADAFVRKEMRRMVSKPNGVQSDKALSYVSKSPADMLFMLQRWEALGKLSSSFILQEFIGGTEFAVGAWFGPGGFVEGWEHNFEFKALMAGDKGPNTGEMGTVQWFVKKSKLADIVLKPLEGELERIKYVGCIDVNCIIADDGTPYPLEFTMRPGWPAFQLQQRLQTGDPAEWMVEILEGRDPKCFKMNEACVGVVLALPDFPYDRRPIADCVGMPVYGITPDMLDAIHPSCMMAGEAPREIGGKLVMAPCLMSAGTYLMTVTGTGKTVTAARRRAYSVVEKLEIPGSPLYRVDIGGRLKKQLPKLQAMGFAEGIEL